MKSTHRQAARAKRIRYLDESTHIYVPVLGMSQKPIVGMRSRPVENPSDASNDQPKTDIGSGDSWA